MKKIAFFTAGAVPTTDEKNAIAALTPLADPAYQVADPAYQVADPAYQVAVRNALDSTNYGAGPEDFDYIASTGARPSAYSNTGDYPSFDPTNPPTNGLPATQVIVSNGKTKTGITMTGTAGADKTATFTIVAGAITAIAFT